MRFSLAPTFAIEVSCFLQVLRWFHFPSLSRTRLFSSGRTTVFYRRGVSPFGHPESKPACRLVEVIAVFATSFSAIFCQHPPSPLVLDHKIYSKHRSTPRQRTDVSTCAPGLALDAMVNHQFAREFYDLIACSSRATVCISAPTPTTS